MDGAGFRVQKIPRTVRLVFVNEVTIQDAEHLGGFLVQVRRDGCARLHPDVDDRWTEREVTVQWFYLDFSGVARKRQVHRSDVCRFHNFVNHGYSPLYFDFTTTVTSLFGRMLAEFLRSAKRPTNIDFQPICSTVYLRF